MEQQEKANLNNSNNVGLLVIDHNLILPICKKEFGYEKKVFPEIIINSMANSQSQKFICLAKVEEGNLAIKIVISNIKQKKVSKKDSTVYFNVIGLNRVAISSIKVANDHKYASIEANIEPSIEKDTETDNIVKEIKKKLNISKENLISLKSLSNSDFADFVFFNIIIGKAIPSKKKDELINNYLQVIQVMTRIKIIHEFLCNKNKVGNNSQKKLIENSNVVPEKTKKLESKDIRVKKLINYFYGIEDKINEEARKKIFSELESLTSMSTTHNEYKKTLDYVEFGLKLPWDSNSEDKKIDEVRREINTTHYGLEKAKERILEYLVIKKLNPEANGTVILLDGPPGTGKTTLAQSIANAIGRKHTRISMGSCTKPEDITGFLKTYIGSAPGKIAKALHTCGTSNPVIILDEIEKMGSNSTYDPSAVLLQLLDPNQNRDFRDIYLKFGIDLRDVLFICTSNNRNELLPAILDRMEVIDVKGYTLREKILIAKDYIIPKEAKGVGIPKTMIPESIVKYIVNGYTRESGIRGLEKSLKSIITKIAVEKENGNEIIVTKNLVEKRLGLPLIEQTVYIPETGKLINGMAFTHSGMGGQVLPIEGLKLKEEGKGNLIITGRAGNVMLETIKVMRSYVSIIAKEFGIKGARLAKMDIHIHIPDANTKKEGPSASCAFALLLMSILSNKSVRKNLSITGEASLTGRVLPVGGLEEKCSAAIRAGITEIILPKSNKRNYAEFHKEIAEGAQYYFVSTLNEIFEIALGLKKEISKTETQPLALEEGARA